MSNVHIHYVEDSKGDLVDLEYYHPECLTENSPADALLDHPCPEPVDSPVHCTVCSKRIWAVPLTEDGLDRRLEDDFIFAYVDCALWCSQVGLNEGDDTTFQRAGYAASDLSMEAIAEIDQDCTMFRENNRELLEQSGLSNEQAGHDFWLTRNRHGAGFWDRGLGKIGQQLTEAAHVWGTCDLELGDDGLIHIS